uniref:PID domain-containing protein n=1 Tax=Sinocyclocheilus rhinocerous TaxID=307959 RepID=A0A673G0R4_9TELE
MKVATPPPSVLQQSRKMGDLSNELVRHFLIECTPKGVRLKGCPNEPYFGSLTALVCQHSITPMALPCRLIIPKRDPLEELNESSSQTSTNSAAELLKQGAACNVWFLGSVDLESLTGVQGVQKATTVIFSMDPPPTSTVVHFKVSAQGITLTDNQRKLFFRRHYAVNTVIFCALDPQDRKYVTHTHTYTVHPCLTICLPAFHSSLVHTIHTINAICLQAVLHFYISKEKFNLHNLLYF